MDRCVLLQAPSWPVFILIWIDNIKRFFTAIGILLHSSRDPEQVTDSAATVPTGSSGVDSTMSNQITVRKGLPRAAWASAGKMPADPVPAALDRCAVQNRARSGAAPKTISDIQFDLVGITR